MSKGALYGLLSALSFSAYALINKYVFNTYDVDTFSYVVTFSVINGLSALLFLASKGPAGFAPLLHKKIRWVLLLGATGTAALSLFVFAQESKTAANASLLSTGTILTTALFSVIISREKLSKSTLAWMATLFFGLYIAIIGVRSLSLNAGDFIIMAVIFLFGFNNNLSKRLMGHFDSDFIANFRLVFAGIILLIIGLSVKGTDAFVLNAGLWPVIAGALGWLTIIFAFKSIKLVGPNKMIVLNTTHVVITMSSAFLLLGEELSFVRVVGATIILVSVYAMNRHEMNGAHQQIKTVARKARRA